MLCSFFSRIGDCNTLVDSGKPNAVIVIPNNASEFEKCAAQGLAIYLKKVSMPRQAIAGYETITENIYHEYVKNPIYVGNVGVSEDLRNKVAKLNNDGYIIQITPSSIHLLGKTDLGTRFAVFGFLEEYIGVHWYLPEVFNSTFPKNMGTHIPLKTTIVLDPTLDIQEPHFSYRNMGTYLPPNATEFCSHLSKLINVDFTKCTGIPDQCTGIPTIKNECSNIPKECIITENYEGNLWSLRNRINMISDRKYGFKSHGTKVNRMEHSLGEILNPKKYSLHSDYFASVNGKTLTPREINKANKYKIKFNVGNPDLRKALANRIREMINKKNVDIINLFPGDGCGFDESIQSICLDDPSCDVSKVTNVKDVNNNCIKAGSKFGRVLSRRYTIFYHELIKLILKEYPNGLKDTLLMPAAYSAYQYPPIEVNDQNFISNYKMDNNVMLMITRNFSGVNSPIGPRSIMPNILFYHSVNDWKKLYSKLGVYEFYSGSHVGGLPLPITDSISKDIPYYYNNGFTLFFNHYDLHSVGTYGLNHYVAAKLLWDVTTDLEQLLDGFYNNFYGAAAPHMKEYFKQLGDANKSLAVMLSPPYSGGATEVFTEEVLTKCKQELKKAKKKVTGNDLLLNRVELSQISLNYTQLIVEYLKEIKELVGEIDQELVWRTINSTEMNVASYISNNIKYFIDKYREYKTVRLKQNHRLLRVADKPGNVIDDLRRYRYGTEFTKSMWLKKNKKPAIKGYNKGGKCEIWMYANDIDLAEHEIRVIDHTGLPKLLGKLAKDSSEAGSREDKGFILSPFKCNDLIGSDDKVSLEINYTNQGKDQSAFYAIAIMPKKSNIQQDKVTKFYQEDINFVRKNSIGFIEFKKINKIDDRILPVQIEIYQ